MATDVVNSEHNKLEHDPTMASIAGPSMGQDLWPKMDPSLYQGYADRLDPYGQGLMDHRWVQTWWLVTSRTVLMVMLPGSTSSLPRT